MLSRNLLSLSRRGALSMMSTRSMSGVPKWVPGHQPTVEPRHRPVITSLMEEIKDASPAKKEQVKAEVRDTISIILAETGADLEFAASQGEDQLMAKSVEFFGEANSPFKGVSSEGVVFMTHIVQNGLLDEYRDVAEQFVAHYNWENKVVDANVVSATPLTADQSKKLKAKISSNIPKDYTLAFSTTTDPSVLGGFSVELGETYVDLTAKTAIDSYAKELSDSA